MSVTTSQTRTVFISYAREDEPLILPVARLLRAAGAVVFLDQENIPYGDKWEPVLLEQLLTAERILVFWSASAANSAWVRREYLTAIEAGLRVVPIPLDATPLPAELATLQALTALVPLVYQVHSNSAPPRREAWRLSWSPWYGAMLAVVFVSLISITLTLRSSPAAEAEYSEPTPLLRPSVWVFLGVAVLISLMSLIFRRREAPSAERSTRGEERSLQTAVYDVVFGENESVDSA